MPGIFISYRRSDSGGHTGRLRDHLSAHFGKALVFQDVDIGDGEIFADVIDRALKSCDVVLVVIGRDWLGASASGGNRLNNADDWVRLEVATAVRRNIRVIPILVEGATLPARAALPADCQPILDRNARELRDVSWGTDVDQLLQSIEKSVKPPTPVERYVRAISPRTLIAASLVLLAIVGLVLWLNSVSVPNVIGMPIDDARQTIQSARITVLKETRAPSPGRIGVVLTQDPQPGRRWKTGLNLVVSEKEPVDLSKYVRIRQQGSEGTGPAFAVAAAIDASLAAQGASVIVSPRYLYAKARLRDKLPAGQDGANPSTVLAVAAESGVPTEQEWPYRAGNGQLPAGVSWAALDRMAMKHRATVTRGRIDCGDLRLPEAAAARRRRGSWHRHLVQARDSEDRTRGNRREPKPGCESFRGVRRLRSLERHAAVRQLVGTRVGRSRVRKHVDGCRGEDDRHQPDVGRRGARR